MSVSFPLVPVSVVGPLASIFYYSGPYWFQKLGIRFRGLPLRAPGTVSSHAFASCKTDMRVSTRARKLALVGAAWFQLGRWAYPRDRSEEHTSELPSHSF